MKILILGAGLMGRAIAYDLGCYSDFKSIIVADNNKKACDATRVFLKESPVEVACADVNDTSDMKKRFKEVDVVVSAVPYYYNYELTKLAIASQTHFIDLGGNNSVVRRQKRLFSLAKENNVTIIPDSGLAPGLVSVITRDIVDRMDRVKSVLLRVGGLPKNPVPPLNYQIVFSPQGLINEYVEDAIVLDSGRVIVKHSLTELESLRFPAPFGRLEAFVTSGGCSTLPYTYMKTIGYLDYKTIRYPGHCQIIKACVDLGFTQTLPMSIKGTSCIPRDVFAALLQKNVPTKGEDVVLVKVISQGTKNGDRIRREYMIIDYYDTVHNMSAMMRTTGYPVAITAQMIQQGVIQQPGVFCPEEIISPVVFFKELQKRNIKVKVSERRVSS